MKLVGNVSVLAALAVARDRIQVAIQAAGSVYPATALVSLRCLLELVDERLAQPASKTAVLFVEVERFKYLADDHGRKTSAAVLAEISRRLHSAVGSDGHRWPVQR